MKLLPLALLFLATACGLPTVTKPFIRPTDEPWDGKVNKDGEGGADKSDSVPLSGGTVNNSKEPQDKVDETANIPNVISGALLRCALASDPVQAGPEITVACRFENKAGQRVALTDIAKLTVFSYAAPEGSTAQISVENLSDSTVYDVAYYFKAKDKSASEAIAKATEIKVAFQNLLSGEQDQGLSVKLGTILKIAIATIKELHALAVKVYAVIKSKADEDLEVKSEKAEEVRAEIDKKLREAEAFFKKIFDE